MDTADTVIESWLKREFFGLADGNRWTQTTVIPQRLARSRGHAHIAFQEASAEGVGYFEGRADYGFCQRVQVHFR